MEKKGKYRRFLCVAGLAILSDICISFHSTTQWIVLTAAEVLSELWGKLLNYLLLVCEILENKYFNPLTPPRQFFDVFSFSIAAMLLSF